METKDLDDALERLYEDQRRLDEVTNHYRALTHSRFQGLRDFWGGLGQAIGRSQRLPAFPVPAMDSRYVLDVFSTSEERLLAGWEWRQEQNALSTEPIVSLIIPAYNKAAVTIKCLQSIVDTWFESLPVQIILADDASTDRTASIAKALRHLTVSRNDDNLGFLLNCNRAATLATGKYICFLNNDTAVTNGWLEELVLTAERDDSIGAVGSKLVYPDGRLQEAGAFFWRDGNAWNYGRGGVAEEPRYNYLRDVDYCSGAALLVRTDLFREYGGFSTTFAPAYYEDSDLCFAVRSMGYRVVYQPRSVVVHYEGLSNGRSIEDGVKRNQALNRPKFMQKWKDALGKHLEHNPRNALQAARRLGRPKTLMMIDNYVPEPDKDSGSNKLFNIILQFQQLGFDVVYVPDNYYRSEPYTTNLQRLGVEVLYGGDGIKPIADAVRERLDITDFVWIGRPDICAKWLPVVREHPEIPVVYDTHDLHYVRVERELALKGIEDEGSWERWRTERDRELRVCREVDVAITVTDVEKRVLEEEGVAPPAVIPNVHDISERARTFDETAGLLFIGGYQHGPNVDAAEWLCREIMPQIWEKLPQVRLTLLGSKPPDVVKALANDRVAVPGYLHDVSFHFQSARVFVAPLRFGAGLKGKIGQAFGYGLPTVTTTIGAEGFGIVDGDNAFIADDAENFAARTVELYSDREKWARLSAGAVGCVRQFSPESVRERLETLVDTAIQRRKQPAR